MSIQLDSEKESEQKFFFNFDYFINFSREKFLSLLVWKFMIIVSSSEVTLKSFQLEDFLYLHRNDGDGSRAVKCVHQKIEMLGNPEAKRTKRT